MDTSTIHRERTESRCAVCGARLDVDGPVGFVHPENGSVIAEDGHLVVPLSAKGYRFLEGVSIV